MPISHGDQARVVAMRVERGTQGVGFGVAVDFELGRVDMIVGVDPG